LDLGGRSKPSLADKYSSLLNRNNIGSGKGSKRVPSRGQASKSLDRQKARQLASQKEKNKTLDGFRQSQNFKNSRNQDRDAKDEELKAKMKMASSDLNWSKNRRPNSRTKIQDKA
jgi:hypothetical protein